MFYPRSNSSLPEERSRSPIFHHKGRKASDKKGLYDASENQRVTKPKSKLKDTENNISEVDVEPIKVTLDNKVRVRDSKNLRYFKCDLTVSFRGKPAIMSSRTQQIPLYGKKRLYKCGKCGMIGHKQNRCVYVDFWDD